MEFMDILIIVLIIAALFYARINWPDQFNSVMDTAQKGFQAVFGVIEGVISKSGDTSTPTEEVVPESTGGG